MTIKELNILSLIKNEILYTLDLENLSNIELFNIINGTIDLEEFDLSTISDLNKEFVLNEVEGYIHNKSDLTQLENILEYIQQKDYDLEGFLEPIGYNEKNLNITTLSSKEVSHIANELQLHIPEFEYEMELFHLEENLSSIEQKHNELIALAYESNMGTSSSSINNEINSLIEETNKLNKEIQALKDNHSKINMEEEIKKIQAKKYLSPKELSIIFPDMSIISQQTYRGRLKDKIPFNQKNKKCKITYTVSEVEEWIENQNWKHK